jgi:16S rRNA processing protein RimM
VLAARPHQGRFIVSFAGVVDRDGAEGLRGARLLAAPIEGDPDAWFVHELIGCELVDLAGRVLGTVTAVQANPASDLLVLDEGHLVPLRFVVRRSPGRLVADLPEGLIE